MGAAALPTAALLARRKLIESRTPGRRQMPDLFGALLFAIAIGALVLGVVKGQDWGWGDPRIIVAFATAVCAGVLFVWRCTWHRSPIIDLSLLRIRTFSAANAMGGWKAFAAGIEDREDREAADWADEASCNPHL